MNPTSETTLAAYRTFVETNGRLPRTLLQLAETAALPVQSIEEAFSSIHDVAQTLWEELTFIAADTIRETPEFLHFSRSEQIVSIFMAVLDACDRERALTLLTFKPDPLRPVTRGIPLLDGTLGIRRGLQRLLTHLVAHSDPPPSLVTKLVDDRIVIEAIIGAFLSALAFWGTDTSTSKAQTEAYVDHLATVIASALESKVGNALGELAHFVVKTRGLPLLSTLLHPIFPEKKGRDEQ